MQIRPGSRLKSTVCDTEVIVVKGMGELDVSCGGAPMADAGADIGDKGEPAADASEGTLMGKRYVDADDTVELLCTKPGAGSLAIAGTPLALKEAKPLPASD